MTERLSALTTASRISAEIDGGASVARGSHAAERTRRVHALHATLTALLGETPRMSDRSLEFGCGHGHFLTAFAAKHPAVQCLGVDFCRDRIRRAERKLHRARLANLRFIHAEAGEFLDALPDGMHFRRVFVLFPDPWPKRRHRKHRLVSAGFLDRVAAVSTTGCEFFFRSDAVDYAAEVRVLLSEHPRWRLDRALELPIETETVFQAKALQFDSLAATLVN